MDKIQGMRTFVAVVETGSFTAASKRLGLTDKLASKYIAALELQLGMSLLHRTTRSMSLTHDGRIYLDGCRRVLAEIDLWTPRFSPQAASKECCGSRHH